MSVERLTNPIALPSFHNGPDLLYKNLLKLEVLLFDIYQFYPNGFNNPDEINAKPIRTIANYLFNCKGGEILREVHARFSTKMPNLSKNLENVWHAEVEYFP